MRDERSVGRLLNHAFGVLVSLIVGFGLVQLGVVLVEHRTVQQLSEVVQPLQLANDEVRDALADAQRGLRGYLQNGEAPSLETYRTAQGAFFLAAGMIEKLATGADTTAVDTQLAQARAWWTVAEQERQATPGSTQAAALTAQNTARFDAFLRTNQQLRTDLAGRARTLHKRSTTVQWIAVGVVALVTVSGILVAIRTSTRTRQRILDPLSDMVTVLEGRQTGDRTVRASVHGPAEIRAVAEALNGAADQDDLVRRHEAQVASRLQALDKAKSDFMSTVSHELRTPLTSISGYLELVRDPETGELNEAQDRMLEVISRNTRRLRELIEDILTLSRIETGDFRSDLGDVDLAEVIERAIGVAAPAAARASVELHCDVRGPLPTLGDGAQLDRVLANLLSNAVKFTPSPGTVTVRARRDGRHVALEVADTGMGIPVDEQQALFARFFRATNAIRQAVPGTGLGLAIVRTIIDNHGGVIEVQSAENAGTTVSITLPAGETVPAHSTSAPGRTQT